MKPLSLETAKYFAPIQFSTFDRIHLVPDETETKFSMQCWNSLRGNDRNGNPIKDQPSRHVMKLITRLPESKRIAAFGCPCAFEVPITDYTCDLIHALFPADQLSFHDDYSKALFDRVIQKSENAIRCVEINSAYRDNKEVPDEISQWEFSADDPLSPYQQVGLCLTMRSVYPSGGFSLFMEQGTGKTPIAVAAVCNLAKMFAETNNRMFRVLVLCPNNVRANWQNEFLKFATQQGKISVMRGVGINRVKQIYDAGRRDDPDDKYTVVIAGYDTAKKSIAALTGRWDLGDEESDNDTSKDKPIVWDLVILDESQYIKSSKTKRWEAMEHLRDASTSHIVLTGTPIANSVLDMYTQFEFLGKGCSGFSDFRGFSRFYGVYETTQSGHEALVDVQNLPFMRERLARLSYIIRKKEALPDLPDKLYDICEVEMTPDQSEFYKDVATQLAVEIERDLASDNMPRSMKVNCILTKLLRLAQITSGFMSWQPVLSDDGSTLIDKRIEYFYPNPKIEMLRELLADKEPNQKTIIWACFVPDIEYIMEALKADGIDCVEFYGATSDTARKDAEYRFNYDRNCKVFVGNPAAGGTGLNLLGYPPGAGDDYDTNCDHVIYYSQNWSMLARGQSEDRANRRGTRTHTRITDLVVPQTIDEEIRTRVLGKQVHALEVADLRGILSNVFKAIEDFK